GGKRAAFEERSTIAVGDCGVPERKEQTRFKDFREIGNGGIIEEKNGIFGVVQQRIAATETDFSAGVVEDQSHHFILRFSRRIDDEGGEELGEDIAAVGRPAERIYLVGKSGIGKIEFGIEPAFFLGDGFFVAINENGIFIDREFAALEKTAAFAARVNPDV